MTGRERIEQDQALRDYVQTVCETWNLNLQGNRGDT